MFPSSMRALAAEGSRRWLFGLLLVLVLLASWGAWFLLAPITVYEITPTARLEVDRAVHPVEAPIAGRVLASRLALAQEVRAGEVLVELDATPQRLHLEEERARLAALAPQLAAIRSQIAAEEQSLEAGRQAARVALEEARVQSEGAEAALQSAEERRAIWERLHREFLVSKLDLLKARAEVRERQASADQLRLTIGRIESERQAREKSHQARLAQLEAEVASLTGQARTAAAAVARLEQEIEKRRIRAPVGGQLGEAATLRIGAMVREGDKLASVVPPGELRAVAYFPPAALGRLKPHQAARLRLHGFPWTEYGSIGATVAKVASEPRDGLVRVELALGSGSITRIPVQHGLPGTVEVEVDRASAATLVLRAAGQLLTASRPGAEAGRAGGRGQ